MCWAINEKEPIIMKGFRLFLLSALLTALTVGTVAAADHYVYINGQGQWVVLDYVPIAPWTRVDGPFATADAAKRARGIGVTKVFNPPREKWNSQESED